jgi:hypothetical protein
MVILTLLLFADVLFLIEITLEFILYCNAHGIFKALNIEDAKRRLPDSVKRRTKRDLKICLTLAVILIAAILII